MSNPLATKLGCFCDLSADDSAALKRLSIRTRQAHAGTDLIQQGDRPDNVFLLIEGWACRYKVLPDGKRHIMAYLIPGDLCDINIFILKEMDHNIGLLSDSVVATIAKREMLELIGEHPRVAQALLWATLVDEAVLREWLVNIGQRDAYSRVAHLFCEMWLRMFQVGLANEGEIHLPLTQEQIGDTMGLTKVHVNRVIQRMRSEGLISISGKILTIHDMRELKKIAGFDPNYLHLDRRVQAGAQNEFLRRSQ